MYVVAVTAFVKPQNVQQFIAATLDNARSTRKEPGNLRFDVLQAEEDKSRFMLYEAYKTKDDFAAHQQTPHYLKWKQKEVMVIFSIVYGMMGNGASGLSMKSHLILQKNACTLLNSMQKMKPTVSQ